MRKTTLAALAVTVPLVAIALRELSKLFAGLAGQSPPGPSPLLWIAGILATLLCLWVAVVLWNRAQAAKKKGGLSFEMVAAMAIAEAKKRPPAGKCARCGRPRLSETSPRCLFCGASFGSSAAAESS